MGLKKYTVRAPSGVYLVEKFYSFGSILVLSDQEAKYLILSNIIQPFSSELITPTTDPVKPVPITETNTNITIEVSGTDREITIENLINLFPRLIPAKGDKGNKGDKGEKGEKGDTAVLDGISDVPGLLNSLSLKANINDERIVNAASRQEVSSVNVQILDAVAADLNLKANTNDSRIVGALQVEALLSALENALINLPISPPAGSGKLWLNDGVITRTPLA